MQPQVLALPPQQHCSRLSPCLAPGSRHLQQFHALAGVPIPARSCRPILEPGLFPGIVTRSSCVCLQTEQEWEPGARVCVPAVAQATRGQPEAAKILGGQGQAPGTAALGRRGRPSRLCPAGRAAGGAPVQEQKQSGASVRTGFIAEPGYSAGLQHPLVRASRRERGGHGGSGRRPLPMARRHQTLPGCIPGLARGRPGSSGTNGRAGSELPAELGKRQGPAASGRGRRGGGRRRPCCGCCGVKAGPRRGGQAAVPAGTREGAPEPGLR